MNCRICKTDYPETAEYFHRHKRNKNGLHSECKSCAVKIVRAWEKANPEKAKEHSKKRSKYKAAKWRKDNKDKTIRYSIKYKKAHPELIKKWNIISGVRKRSTPQGKLNNSMSSAIRRSMKPGIKANRHWESLLNYDARQLRKHIEKLFQPGMTWENYGAWHIDHKIPLTAFNFENPADSDFKKCWALKNLQPMWASDNIRKCNKLARPFQPSLLI